MVKEKRSVIELASGERLVVRTEPGSVTGEPFAGFPGLEVFVEVGQHGEEVRLPTMDEWMKHRVRVFAFLDDHLEEAVESLAERRL
jgi:hypothetical protein